MDQSALQFFNVYSLGVTSITGQMLLSIDCGEGAEVQSYRFACTASSPRATVCLTEGQQMHYKKEICHSEGGEALAQLPREAVAAPSLAVFKARLDRAPSTPGWWKGSLVPWNKIIYKVPSNPF